MNHPSFSHWQRCSVGLSSLSVLFASGCADFTQQNAPASFASVRPVFESNCVHCHGPNRLAHMPALADTRSLAGLIGPANWIVPGHPERSRFFEVVTLTDAQPGAMPPTGHAISAAEVEKLRAWIVAGAPVPDGEPVALVPRGEGPRSQ